jgi:hypothetical protein
MTGRRETKRQISGPATTPLPRVLGWLAAVVSDCLAYATRHIASPAAAFSQLRSGLIASSNVETSSKAT